jgi:EGF-like domain
MIIIAPQRNLGSLLVLLCFSDVSILRAEFCSSNEDCQHGGYCDDEGIMGGAEDPNHPQIFESTCVCPDTYTGTYCTEPVSLADDLSSNQNPSSHASNDDNASFSTGAIVALSIVVPMMLAMGFLCGVFFATQPARATLFQTEEDSPENAVDGEEMNEYVKTDDEANTTFEVEQQSIEVV